MASAMDDRQLGKAANDWYLVTIAGACFGLGILAMYYS